MGWVGKVVVVTLLLLVITTGCTDNDKPVPEYQDTRPCNMEKLRLLGIIVYDHDKLWELKEQLQEIDPSNNILIATEMQDFDSLEKYFRKEQEKCLSQP